MEITTTEETMAWINDLRKMSKMANIACKHPTTSLDREEEMLRKIRLGLEWVEKSEVFYENMSKVNRTIRDSEGWKIKKY